MALSGEYQVKSTEGEWYYKITWSAIQNIESNRSDITVEHYFIASYAINIGGNTGSYSQINGSDTKYYTYDRINISSGTKHIGTTNHIVYHNTDGTKTCSFKCMLNSPFLNTPTINTSFTLDSIPRVSTFEIVDTNLYPEDLIKVNITRASNSFTHNILYSFGNYNKRTENVATTDSFTIPFEWLNAIPSAISGSGTVKVSTYSDGILIGSAVKGFTLSAPSNIIPSFSSISTEAMPSFYNNLYVQSKSAINIGINGAVGVYGSNIQMYEFIIRADGVPDIRHSSNNSNTFLTPILSNNGDVTVYCRITDSRGRQVQKNISLSYQSYRTPFLYQTTTVERVNASGVEDPMGGRIKVTPIAGFSTVDGNNSLNILRYRWKTLSSAYSGYINVNNGESSFFDASVDNTHIVEISYQDDITTTIFTKEFTVSTSQSVIDIKNDGTGVAFGGASGISNAVEVKGGWDLIVDGHSVANTESGFWTPEARNDCFTINTIESARYLRIGKLIYATARIRFTKNASIEPYVITGLPFLSFTDHVPAQIICSASLATSIGSLYARVLNNSIYVLMANNDGTEVNTVSLDNRYVIEANNARLDIIAVYQIE